MAHNRLLLNIFEKEYFKCSDSALALDAILVDSEKNSSPPNNLTNDFQIMYSKSAWV